MPITELARFLRAQVDRTSYEQVSERTGVGRGTIEDLVKGRHSGYPTLVTLIRIADAYGIPLYQVQEMAGVDLDLPGDRAELTRRLESLVSREPAWTPLLELLTTADPRLSGPILRHVEALYQLGQEPPPSRRPSDRPEE